MKICMPVSENTGDKSKIFGHFGSAPYFAIYDTDNKSVSVIKNSVGEHEHGTCMPVDAIGSTGAKAVLCKGMGMRAANLLIEAGIIPYIVDAETVSDAINQYNAKNITKMNASNSCHGHDCH